MADETKGEPTAPWTRAPLGRFGLAALAVVVLLINLPLFHMLVRGEQPAGVTLPWRDDFNDADTVTRNYFSTGGFWRVVAGELLSPGVKNNPLWLKAKLPQNVVVEFDVRSMAPDGDIRVEIFGNGLDHGSGYVLIHSGWGNGTSVIARLDENAPSLASQVSQGTYGPDSRARVETVRRAEPGRRYHYRIERQGSVLRWSIDGQELLRYDDPFPLAGTGHDRVGLSSWESQLYFDNLTVTPNDGSAALPPAPPPSAVAQAPAPPAVAPGAPPPALAAPPTLPPPAFKDDFNRKELGPDWLATGPDAVTIEDGALTVQKVHNRPVWLKKPLPDDALVEFDTWTDDKDGDIKVEVWGDGKSFYQGDLTAQYTATGYVFIFGGWKNDHSVMARMMEHAPNQPSRADVKVLPGKHYHVRIGRKAGRIEWAIDGTPFLGAVDPMPLTGPGHQGFAFSGWETKVHFDNLVVTPL